MSNDFFQHFQRDIVRGVEGYIVTGSKQVEIGGNLDVIPVVSYILKSKKVMWSFI